MSVKVSKRKASAFEEAIPDSSRSKEKQAKTNDSDYDQSINHHDSPLPHTSPRSGSLLDPFTPPMKPTRLVKPPASIESVAVPSMAALTLTNNQSAPPSPESANKQASPASSAIRARDARDAAADPRCVKRSRAAVKLETTFRDHCVNASSHSNDAHQSDELIIDALIDMTSPHQHATAAVDSACVQMRQISISSFSLASVPTSSQSQSITTDSLINQSPLSGLETMNQSLGISLTESTNQSINQNTIDSSHEHHSPSSANSVLPSDHRSDTDSDCDEVPQLPVISRRFIDGPTGINQSFNQSPSAEDANKTRHSIYENESSVLVDDDVSSVQSITSTQISVETNSSSFAQSINQSAIRCEICNKDLSGVAQYEAHILGRKHVHAALMAASGGQFCCHLCNKVFTCVDDREKHMMSDKHKKNVNQSINQSAASTSPRSQSTEDTMNNAKSRRTMSSHSLSDEHNVGISKKRKFGRSSPSSSLAASSPTPAQFKSARDHSGSQSSPSHHSIRYLTPVETCADGSLPVVRLHVRLSEGDRSSSNSPIPVSRVSSSGRSSVDQSILRSPERIQPPPHMNQPTFAPHLQYHPHPNQYQMHPFTMGSSSTPMYAFLSPAALAALNGPIMPSLTPITVLYPTEMVMNHAIAPPMMMDPQQYTSAPFWPHAAPPPSYQQFYHQQQDGYHQPAPFSMPIMNNSQQINEQPNVTTTPYTATPEAGQEHDTTQT